MCVKNCVKRGVSGGEMGILILFDALAVSTVWPIVQLRPLGIGYE